MAESIQTLKASGGDYTSIQTWWDTECDDYDFVTNTTSKVLECYNDWPTGKSEIASFSVSGGYSANDTYKSIVRPAAGEGHTGIPGTGFKLIYSANYTNIIAIGAGVYCDIDGLDTEHSGSGSGVAISSSYGRALNCLARNAVASASRAAIALNAAGATAKGCLAYDSIRGIGPIASYTGAIIENCTAVNCTSWGFRCHGSSGANITLKNNVAYGCAVSYAEQNAIDAASTNNAASDASTNTPPGSNPITTDIVSGDFVDAANDDYHLASGSTLIGAGANLYTDGSDVDIDGDAWPDAAWDIGFDYYVAAGGGDIAATLSTTTEAASASFAGTVTAPSVTATLTTTTAASTASIAGTVTAPGYNATLSAVTENNAVSFAGTVVAPSYTATIASSTADSAATFAGTVDTPGFHATQSTPTAARNASFAGTVVAPSYTAVISATTENSNADFAGTVETTEFTATLATTTANSTASFAGSVSIAAVTGTLSTTTDNAIGRFWFDIDGPSKTFYAQASQQFVASAPTTFTAS